MQGCGLGGGTTYRKTCFLLWHQLPVENDHGGHTLQAASGTQTEIHAAGLSSSCTHADRTPPPLSFLSCWHVHGEAVPWAAVHGVIRRGHPAQPGTCVQALKSFHTWYAVVADVQGVEGGEGPQTRHARQGVVRNLHTRCVCPSGVLSLHQLVLGEGMAPTGDSTHLE
jgi:hypothetical protein